MTRKMAGSLRIFVLLSLLSCHPWPRAASAQVTLPVCGYAGLMVRDWGAERVRSYVDPAGRSVEVWCIRSLFTAHYVVRIGWNDREHAGAAAGQPTAVVRQVRTMAGCYFTHGDNEGPDISEDSAHAFTKVTWTNQDAHNRATAFRFSYDWTTGKLTITATAPGLAPVVRIVDPPDTYEALHKLLPDL